VNSKRQFQQGFSLLEILIAFSILALSLGVLLNIFSGGLRRSLVAEEYQQAITVAQSILAKSGVEEELKEGRKQGTIDEKYTWSESIRAFEEDGLEPEKSGLFPYHVTVIVEWQAGDDNRHVELTTLRLSGNPSDH
jgi:general secretion pathway protein I